PHRIPQPPAGIHPVVLVVRNLRAQRPLDHGQHHTSRLGRNETRGSRQGEIPHGPRRLADRDGTYESGCHTFRVFRTWNSGRTYIRVSTETQSRITISKTNPALARNHRRGREHSPVTKQLSPSGCASVS